MNRVAGSRRSGIIRGLSWLVIDLCLLFSVLSIWLAWGVLYPQVDELGPNDRFDAIVVLSGEERRIERGIALAEEGRAPVLVISYGEQWASISDRCGTNVGYRIICLDPPEDSTRGEARMIRRLTATSGWKSSLVVTSGYHVTRAHDHVTACKKINGSAIFHGPLSTRIAPEIIRSESLKRLGGLFHSRTC